MLRYILSFLIFTTIFSSNTKASDYTISTVAGNGTPGYTGDCGPAISAKLNLPCGVCSSSEGDLYIADTQNSAIRKVDEAGKISTILEQSSGYYGGGYGYCSHYNVETLSALVNPAAVCIDLLGRIYIADTMNHMILMIENQKTQIIAGTGTPGYSGDDGIATAAELNSPSGVWIDNSNTILVADTGNNRIRKFTLGGIISTLAGTGTAGYSGDGGPATAAQLYAPQALCADYTSNPPNVFVADTGNHCIRQISSNGTITTIAGTGTAGYSGDGNLATAAKLFSPQGVFMNSFGQLFIADTLNNVIRTFFIGGNISTIAGTGTPGYSGDEGLATSAKLNGPKQLNGDNEGSIFIADTNNNRIRVLIPPTQTFSTSSELPGSGIVRAIIKNDATVKLLQQSTVKNVEIEDMSTLETNQTSSVTFKGANPTLKITAPSLSLGQLDFETSGNVAVDTGTSILSIAPTGGKTLNKQGAGTLEIISDISAAATELDIQEGTVKLAQGAKLPNNAKNNHVIESGAGIELSGSAANNAGGSVTVQSGGKIVVDTDSTVSQGVFGQLTMKDGAKIVLGKGATFGQNITMK